MIRLCRGERVSFDPLDGIRRTTAAAYDFAKTFWQKTVGELPARPDTVVSRRRTLLGLGIATMFAGAVAAPAMAQQIDQYSRALAATAIAGGAIGTLLQASSQVIPAPVKSVRTSGYAAAGDGGGALYKRVASLPSHAGYFQSRDGAYWEIGETTMDPRYFGAKFDGTTDDRAGWQTAIDVSQALSVAIFVKGGGVSKVVATGVQQFIYGNTVSTGVYRALNIDVSNLQIIGDGVTIRFVGSTGGNSVNYLFATGKNLNVGDRVNLKFSGLKLDFDPTGDASVNKRSFYFGGCEGVWIDDIRLLSSGARAGATITFQQCRTVRVTNLRAKNITQGFNLSYVTDVIFANHEYDNFSEAIDFDRVVDQFVCSALTFRNGGPSNQAFDLNSVTNGYISGLTAFNLGNIFIINYKTTTLPTYAEYLAYIPWSSNFTYVAGQTISNGGNKYICATGGVSAASGGPTGTGAGIVDGSVTWNYQSAITFVPSRNVTVEGVKGDTIGSVAGGGQSCFSVYSESSSALCENITIRNVELTKCYGEAICNLVKNLVLEDVYLNGCVTTTTSFGALTIGTNDLAAVTSVADCSATLRNVQVVGTTGVGPCFRISSQARLTIDGTRAERDGSVACTYYDFQNIDLNAGKYVLGRTRIVNTGASVHASTLGWKFGESASPTQNYKIVWGPGHSFAGPLPALPFGLNGGSPKRIEPNRRAHVGVLDVTTGKVHEVGLNMTDTEKSFVAYASMSVFTALGASGTNYVAWNTRSIISGVDTAVSSGDDQAGLAQATRMDLGNNIAKTAALLGPGDAYYVKFTAVGAGRTYEGLNIQAAVLDFNPI